MIIMPRNDYEKMSPRKSMASGGGASSSGLPKKSYPEKMDGDGAPKTKSSVSSLYPQSKLLGKATAGGLDGDKDY